MKRRSTVPLVIEIPQNKLPTELQVLGHYLWLLNQRVGKPRSSRDLAREAVKAVIKIWDKAFIPCVDQRNALRLFFDHRNSVYKRYVNMIVIVQLRPVVSLHLGSRLVVEFRCQNDIFRFFFFSNYNWKNEINHHVSSHVCLKAKCVHTLAHTAHKNSISVRKVRKK